MCGLYAPSRIQCTLCTGCTHSTKNTVYAADDFNPSLKLHCVYTVYGPTYPPEYIVYAVYRLYVLSRIHCVYLYGSYAHTKTVCVHCAQILRTLYNTHSTLCNDCTYPPEITVYIMCGLFAPSTIQCILCTNRTHPSEYAVFIMYKLYSPSKLNCVNCVQI